MSKEERKISADKQRIYSAKAKPRGRPFEKGNTYAWRSGQSGNPQGRPKVITLSEACRQYLAEVDPADPHGRTRAEIAAVEMYGILTQTESYAAAVAAFKEMADRTEGKARQSVEVDPGEKSREMLSAMLGIPVERIPVVP